MGEARGVVFLGLQGAWGALGWFMRARVAVGVVSVDVVAVGIAAVGEIGRASCRERV